MYELSEQMGVSPWYWWADVPVPHHDVVAFGKDLVCDHGAPTVKYRGIFINDENPVLQVGMYEKMFELMLRLKANYFWPASEFWLLFSFTSLTTSVG
jgi:hypothetical protein